MSNPSTPHSSMPCSTSQSPTVQTPDILTPSRKVKALLAQFDDDSDSPSEVVVTRTRRSPTTAGATAGAPIATRPISDSPERNDDSRSSEDEDILLKPRGRMAARMRARGSPETQPTGKNPQQGKKQEDKNAGNVEAAASNRVASRRERSSSEDELAAPRRRLMQKKSSPAEESRYTEQGSRSPSPLFVPSPGASHIRRVSDRGSSGRDGSDSEDLPEDPLNADSKSKFMALVEKHRKQRLEKEAEGEKKRAARLEQLKEAGLTSNRIRGSSPADSSAEDSELEAGLQRDTSKNSRPARGASKKALEEMKREQERIKRNMQLAHQTTTKKKITKESLLARFNFLPQSDDTSGNVVGTASATASSEPASDVESRQEKNTPPTSPLPLDDDTCNEQPTGAVIDRPEAETINADDHELPDIGSVVAETKIDKGKGKATEEDYEYSTQTAALNTDGQSSKPRPIRVRLSKEAAIMNHTADDDLEILSSPPTGKSKLPIFDKLPTKKAYEAPSHHLLRALANLNNPAQIEKNRKHMTSAEMDISLRQRARVQAAQERVERIEALKAKGVYIQTAEEREKDQQEVEDLVEKARQEGAEIARREKALAKKNGEVVHDGLDDSDDEDDEDFQDEDEEQDSGSDENDDERSIKNKEDRSDEDEDVEEEIIANDEEAIGNANGMIDDQANEEPSDEQSDEEARETDSVSDDEIVRKATPTIASRRAHKSRILSDDEDEGGKDTSPAPRQNLSVPKTPQSVPRSARKEIPGLPMSDDLPLGLTQAFAATMADSQTEYPAQTQLRAQAEQQEQDSFSILHSIPSPAAVPMLRRESTDLIEESLPATQTNTQPLDLSLSFTQHQRVPESPMTQISEIPDPTQDAGYVMTPWKGKRFSSETPQQIPQSTVETVLLQSPLVGKKSRGRLQRCPREPAEENLEYFIDPSAFDVLRSSARLQAKQPPRDYEKEKSKAKDMVEEAAEESDDEWAGAGGRSDDDGGSEDEDDRQMINDDGKEKVDEGVLARLHK